MATKFSVLNVPVTNANYKKMLETSEDKSEGNEQTEEPLVVYKKGKMNSGSPEPATTLGGKIVLGAIAMNQQHSVQSAKKRRVSDANSNSGNTTRVKQPQAVAVARRNARERNRVKQVNNGFASLREHIPEEIAETYETVGKSAGKKLSKVETLRMAVEYIRILEGLLNLDSNRDSLSVHNSMNFSSVSSNMSETSLPATPPPDQPIFYAIKPRQIGFTDMMDESETQITIINGLQYIRIPGTDTFQLINPREHFENEENIHPSESFMQTNFNHTTINQILTETTNKQLLESSSLNFININDPNISTTSTATTTSLIHETPLHLITPAESTAPSTFSGHSSLSPAAQIDNINNNNMVIRRPKFESVAEYETRNIEMKTNFHQTILLQNSNGTEDSNDGSHYEHIILKQEIEDGMFDDNSLENENMVKNINWWQQAH